MEHSSAGKKNWEEEFGFVAQLNKNEYAYDLFSSYLQYAVAHYSHFYETVTRNPLKAFVKFSKAKECALVAEKTMRSQKPEVTHGDCLVLSAILIQSWLWKKAAPTEAVTVLTFGLNKLDADQVSVALMQMGMAESYFLLNNTDKAKEYILLATRETSTKIAQAGNKTQAIKQIFTILRRAAVLSAKIGDRELESICLIPISNLRAFAGDEVIGKVQIKKFAKRQRILRLPRLLQKLLPQ